MAPFLNDPNDAIKHCLYKNIYVLELGIAGRDSEGNDGDITSEF